MINVIYYCQMVLMFDSKMGSGHDGHGVHPFTADGNKREPMNPGQTNFISAVRKNNGFNLHMF